jgi:hypothetical protein
MMKTALIASALALAAPALAAAQAPAPAPAPATAGAYKVEGFRSAHWGMQPEEVRAAIGKDFPGIVPGEARNPAEGTSALVVKLARLDPAPGPVEISYIFGATKKTLTHINVQWALDGEPTPAQRQAMAAAGLQLVTYFKGLGWPAKSVTGGTPLGKDAVLMFGAVDASGGGVEVLISGIAFQADGEGAKTAPTGPVRLQVSYAVDLAHPDTYKPAPGSF